MAKFVLEIYSEEIPARMQEKALIDFSIIANEIFKKNNLLINESDINFFISNCRIVIIINNLEVSQLQSSIKKTGPKISADIKAIEGFLNANNLKTIDELTIVNDYYVYNKAESTIETAEILKISLPNIMQKMQNNWPKIMRYNLDKTMLQAKWVRPIRSIIALLDDKIINFNYAGINANNFTLNKYFQKIVIDNAKNYEKILVVDNKIIFDQKLRKDKILNQAQKIAQDLQLKLPNNFENSRLLKEIVGLCENPTVLYGAIDNKFLDLPKEALNLTLEHHQKYICCNDLDHKFSNKFLFICDCEVNENNQQRIIADNEKIMRARLDDLEFFINKDLEIHLIEYVEKLKNIIFHEKIGSLFDKVQRFNEIAKFISVFVPHSEISLVDRASLLAKADLASKAVAELPELQGNFGSFYAKKQYENPKICDAIYEHYLPIGINSLTPKSPLGIVLALADKIDNIVSFFLIDEKPTSSKDPNALRRSALGIIRIVHDYNINLPIRIIVERSLKSFNPKLLKKYISSDKKQFFILKKNLIQEIVFFIVDRLKIYLKDQENIRLDVLNVSISSYMKNFDIHKNVDILFLIKKIKFINSFILNKSYSNLIELYKRSSNILTIEEKRDNIKYSGKPSMLGFKNKFEKTLYNNIKNITKNFNKNIANAEFEEAVKLLANLEVPLNDFFANVVVNDVDRATRENRLIMLSLIRDLFNEIVDFSQLDLNYQI